MRLALVIPTRGVIFARTIESSILSPELPRDSHVIIVSGLPIPDAHNKCIERALETDCTHILFIEEDMVIPNGGIPAMIEKAELGFEIVAIDYPLTDSARSTIHYEGEKALWTGFGCTMIARRIFDDVLKKPWLTSDNTVYIESMSPFKYTVKNESERKDKVYGHYDIWFGLQMKKAGIPIKVLSGFKCPHLRMKSWERKTVNAGTHEIYEL
jgi:hypothetical protein